MGWNLPPGCTDLDIDRASPGYWDEPEQEEPIEMAMDHITTDLYNSLLEFVTLAESNIITIGTRATQGRKERFDTNLKRAKVALEAYRKKEQQS